MGTSAFGQEPTFGNKVNTLLTDGSNTKTSPINITFSTNTLAITLVSMIEAMLADEVIDAAYYWLCHHRRQGGGLLKV